MSALDGVDCCEDIACTCAGTGRNAAQCDMRCEPRRVSQAAARLKEEAECLLCVGKESSTASEPTVCLMLGKLKDGGVHWGGTKALPPRSKESCFAAPCPCRAGPTARLEGALEVERGAFAAFGDMFNDFP